MARIAATRADARQIDTLKSISSQLSKAVATKSRNLENVAQLNYQFHSTVAQVAKSKTFSTCHDSLIRNMVIRATLQKMDYDKVVRSLDQHIEIIEAIEAHDLEWAA